MKRERIDKLLVERGLAPSRAKAQAFIMAGLVLVEEQRVEKSSDAFPPAAQIRLKGADNPAQRYVGRGGLKLEAALREFKLDVNGLVCLDVGASTGGFTDCLLQHGAQRVTAVDVGHNQLDWRIRADARVEAREGVNARYLQPADFPEKFALAVMDVSFISVTRILPAIVPLLVADGRIVTLIKPQFEVGKGEVGKGGIVRDAAQHERVVNEVNAAAQGLGLRLRGVIPSPINGADGNAEFLALYEKTEVGIVNIMPQFDPQRRITAAEALAQLPGSGGERFVEIFTHGTLGVEFYAPRGHDPQQPHTRDEAYIVVTGSGEYVLNEERQPFGPGDFLFAPAGAAHRFENFTNDLGVWVIFYGPEGGESKASG